MPVESAADRAVFVNTNEFGTAATYTPGGGAAVTLSGIFDESDGRRFDSPGIVSGQPSFQCRADDLPDDALPGQTQDDRLVIGDRDFAVRVIERDHTGMALMTLEEMTVGA